MALKRRNRVETTFAMSSMTDIIFLLLLFFVISSTMTTPNDIKLNLPSSEAKSSTKQVVAKVSIDADGNYFLSGKNSKPEQVVADELETKIIDLMATDTTTYLALYADQSIPYKEVVRVLDIANKNRLKLVIATQQPTEKNDGQINIE